MNTFLYTFHQLKNIHWPFLAYGIKVLVLGCFNGKTIFLSPDSISSQRYLLAARFTVLFLCNSRSVIISVSSLSIKQYHNSRQNNENQINLLNMNFD